LKSKALRSWSKTFVFLKSKAQCSCSLQLCSRAHNEPAEAAKKRQTSNIEGFVRTGSKCLSSFQIRRCVSQYFQLLARYFLQTSYHLLALSA